MVGTGSVGKIGVGKDGIGGMCVGNNGTPLFVRLKKNVYNNQVYSIIKNLIF